MRRLVFSSVLIIFIAMLLPASAFGAVFPVMHAEGGIFWRAAPNWGTPVGVIGNGFYPGTAVSVECYQVGAPGPDSGNVMWVRASWVSGPGGGSGWMNEHFVDDGAPLNQAAPGVPPCSTPPAAGSTPSPQTAPSPQVVSKTCSSGWVGWARFTDYGDRIAMSLRPTKRAWAVMGLGVTTTRMWDAYFACIGWDDGFDRLSQSQWRSLWLQHRCHEYLGVIGRLKSGATFDYDSSIPDRKTLRKSFANHCN